MIQYYFLYRGFYNVLVINYLQVKQKNNQGKFI